MVVYYHELVCHEEKLVRCLQGQGYSKGLYNQNMTFFCISELVTRLQLSEKREKDHCVQGQGHSEGFK